VILDVILFYVFGTLALAAAIVVVAQRNPMYSAFALIVTLGALSVVFALLGSPFIAVLQVIVYAGAIMVLFLFVLMLLNVQAEERAHAAGGGGVLPVVALGLGALLAAQVGVVLYRAARPAATLPSEFEASSREVAHVLFSVQYAYVFEATSILILSALVGAVVLASRNPAAGREA
jgi:NADH-quinone oxidoreductase subunit J